jgi:hypothetical protein
MGSFGDFETPTYCLRRKGHGGRCTSKKDLADRLDDRDRVASLEQRVGELHDMLTAAEAGLRHGGSPEWLEALADRCTVVRLGG